VAGALLGAASETPAGNRVVVRDAGSGEIVLQATNLPREGVAALDRYRLLELSFEQRNLIEQGFTLPVIADFDSASTFLCHFLAESDTLASSPVAQQDGFLNDETYLALLRFCRGLLMQSPWNSLAPSISLLRTASPSLHDRCSAFLERAGGDIPGVDGAEFLTMVQFIEEYLNLLDASNYRYLDHPGNAAGAGLQSGRTLSVAVSEPTTYLFHAVNRSLDDGTVTVNGKVTRSDGSTTAFSRTFPVTGEAWLVRTVSIDLTGFENAASIVKLEVSVPVTGGVYRALPYGTALAVLVPAGAEFEAVSRDRFGRVFCTLDHSGNFERHERDGLGRVTAVHDHHGNTLQEKTYHEAEKTSNE